MKITIDIFGSKKRELSELEEKLIFSLKNFGMQLDAGLSFEECLAKEKIFGAIIRETELGASIPEALRNFAQRYDSAFIKKASALLADIYIKGGSGSALKKLADEEAAVRLAKIKEYNEKLVMFSLLFVACAAIIPAFFQAFIIVGSLFIAIPISAEAALIIPVLLFPLINTGAFLFIKSRRP